MKRFECKSCHKLLAMISPRGVDFRIKYNNVNTGGVNEHSLPFNLQIKCPKCKKVNEYGEIVPSKVESPA